MQDEIHELLVKIQGNSPRTNVIPAPRPVPRHVIPIQPQATSNKMKIPMLPIKRRVKHLSPWPKKTSNKMTNAMMPNKRGVRHLSPWHHPHPHQWSGGLRNHVWWHRPYPWWNYPQHQWPQPWAGPLACCQRVRIQTSGLTASYRPGTYLHT